MNDPLLNFEGKVALITGGSRGLGYQMAKALAARGADIIIASRKVDACEAVAEEVRAMGQRALAVGAHCGKWDEIDKLIEAAYAEFGRVDILINNAGMGPRMPSHEMPESLYDSVLNLNLKGPYRLASIIQPLAQVVPYSAAKAGLNAMTIGMAKEYAPHVRVNCICAGPFLTDIADAWTDEARQTADNALRRPGRPEEIVSAALYLLSDAASFSTGSVISVDGGT